MIVVEAILYGVSTSVLLAIYFALQFGGLGPLLAVAALSGGVGVASGTLWSRRRRVPRFRNLNAWEWTVTTVFLLFSLRAFLWLVFQDGDAIKVLSPNNLGDLSLHLTYIREFASGVPFWPPNPIYAGATLTYPVGVDLLHCLIHLAGVNLYRTFIWMGLTGCLCTGLALWRWGGAFATAGFLFNGGLAGFLFFHSHDVADFQAEMAWKSIPLALFVTQRGLLFALPAGLLLLSSWRARFFGNPSSETQPGARDADVLPRSGELLLYASMPVFHLHTFLFLSLMLAAWFIAHRPARRSILALVATALVPASLLVFLVTGFLHGPSVLGWQPGWMQTDPDFLATCREHFGTDRWFISFPVFWLANFGVLPVLIGALLVRLARSPQLVWARAAVIPASGIFVLCCFVKFAPWAWDNTKVMIWSYLVILPVLWRRLIAQWPPWAVSCTCAVLFWSGFISLLGGIDGSHQGYPIASRKELDEIADVLREIPATACFVANPDYNHPLVLLGRQIALGYTGHVWSHGYAFEEPLKEEEAILDGSPDWRTLAQNFHARYLFWGSRERNAHPDSTQAWRTEARLVATGEWGEIFDLESPAALVSPPVFPAD